MPQDKKPSSPTFSLGGEGSCSVPQSNTCAQQNSMGQPWVQIRLDSAGAIDLFTSLKSK
ncbi:MAG: hypothetical protein H0U75_04010 [Legionella sp.]|nr:hypothetical protein [Legionella sp.]